MAKDTTIQTIKECFVCRRTDVLDRHHIFGGTGNRKKSEQYGLCVWLCKEHHTGNSGVHMKQDLNLFVKQMGQRYFEENIGNREFFMKEFGKNYL